MNAELFLARQQALSKLFDYLERHESGLVATGELRPNTRRHLVDALRARKEPVKTLPERTCGNCGNSCDYNEMRQCHNGHDWKPRA